MNTINELFNKYGWHQIGDDKNRSFIKNNETRLDEYVVIQNEDNTYSITIPILNSIYSYKNTISNILDVKEYLELHLKE